MDGFSSTLTKCMCCAVFVLPLKAMAVSVDVFCVQQEDPSNWNWLSADNPRAQGEWQYYSYQGSKYEGFRVTSQEYQRLADLCPENTLAQPASSYFSQWHLFIVQDEEQTRMLAPGFLPNHSLNPGLQRPSEIFKPYDQCEHSANYFGDYWSASVCTFSQYPDDASTESNADI